MTKYPLTWPDGWKRTAAAQRKRAKFAKGEVVHSSTPGVNSWLRNRDLTVADGVTRVLDELRRFGIEEGGAIISTNLQVRLDGLPRSGQAEPADPGVAVYWERAGTKGTKVMAIDIYDRVADNLAAIAATLDAMRAIERHGGAQILERAFTGFEALPAPGQTATRAWREVLGVGDRASFEEAERAYKTTRSLHHPDKGGNPILFDATQKAWEQAQQELAR